MITTVYFVLWDWDYDFSLLAIRVGSHLAKLKNFFNNIIKVTKNYYEILQFKLVFHLKHKSKIYKLVSYAADKYPNPNIQMSAKAIVSFVNSLPWNKMIYCFRQGQLCLPYILDSLMNLTCHTISSNQKL